MRNPFLILAACFCLPALADEPRGARLCASPDKILVATYNLLNSNVHRPEQFPEWEIRGPLIAKWAVQKNLDIFSVQEVLPSMLTTLKSGLPEYDVVGKARSENPENGEYSAIFFQRRRFKKLRDGTFWLSPTPTVAGSKGWDAAYVRICTWVELEERTTQKRFFVFNTHFDNEGKTARREGALLIQKKFTELAAGKNVILTGDFNSEEADPALEPFQKMQLARKAAVVAPNGPERSFLDGRRIDHLFSSRELVPCRYSVEEPKAPNGRALSDHLPVLVEFTFQKQETPN